MHRPLPASLFTSSTRKLSKNARDGAHGPRKRHRKLGMHRRHCRKSGLPESFCTYMAYQGSYLFTNCLAYSTLIVRLVSGRRQLLYFWHHIVLAKMLKSHESQHPMMLQVNKMSSTKYTLVDNIGSANQYAKTEESVTSCCQFCLFQWSINARTYGPICATLT